MTLERRSKFWNEPPCPQFIIMDSDELELGGSVRGNVPTR
jgi:hypothetical protein